MPGTGKRGGREETKSTASFNAQNTVFFFFFLLGFVLLCIFKGKRSRAMKGGVASILLLAAVLSQKLEVKCLLQIQL